MVRQIGLIDAIDQQLEVLKIHLPYHAAFLQVPVEGAVEGLVEDLVTLAADLNDTERRLLHALQGQPLAKADLVAALGYRTITGHVRKALDRLDELGLIALTVPEKPRSKNQKRRLTERGKKMLATLDTCAAQHPERECWPHGTRAETLARQEADPDSRIVDLAQYLPRS